MIVIIVIGYILTILNYIVYCSSRFFKEKKHILMLDLFAKILTIIALYCLNSLTGAYSMVISFLVLIASNIKEHKKSINKYINIIIYLIFNILYTIILVLTYNNVASLLIFITCIITLMCVWWFDPQKMRFIGIFNSFIYLSYQILIKNWAGLLEITVVISNILSFIKYKKQKE